MYNGHVRPITLLKKLHPFGGNISTFTYVLDPDIYCTWLYGLLLKDRIKSNALLHKHQLLLALWKHLDELDQEQVELLNFFGEVMQGNIYGPSEPNISLPDNMVRCTYILHHQKSYAHVIICVGFYVDICYWK